MLAVGGILSAVLATAALLGTAVAEAPYHYPAPANSGVNVNGISLTNSNGLPQQQQPLQQTPPGIINSGIISGSPGYVSPSQLIASPPPAVQNLDTNFPPRYSNDYQEPADVHKHVYVHVAPDEPAEHQAPLVVPTRKPKKHYKIVFIKTPTVVPPAAAYVNLPQPDQEKTLIYVLSKKPDLQQSLVLSTPAPTQPAKPEVFFIRYKTNEAQQQQQVVFSGAQPGSGVDSAVKQLTNSYGVPLAAPLGPSSLQYPPSGSPLATAAPGNNAINYNSL